ncbi:hypothetical protein HY414_00695 [Candidatus Kaiserbacteria bacterium]|nr:hypothetical protein [Candidatus Kaiserbacteria bacterium]
MILEASDEQIQKLRHMDATPFSGPIFRIRWANQGVIIRVQTDSGEVYFFEIVDKMIPKAEVVKTGRFPERPQISHRGIHKIPAIITYGEPIKYDNFSTQPVINVQALGNAADTLRRPP